MLKLPAVGGPDADDLLILSRYRESQALLALLQENRQRMLELLTKLSDETLLRQYQGATQTLADLIALFQRTP